MIQLKTRRTLTEAESLGKEFLKSINVSEIKEAREIPSERLLNLFSNVITPDSMPYFPVVDGYIIEEDLISLAVKGKCHNIPTMIGSTSDDLSFSTVRPEDTLETIRDRAFTIYGEKAQRCRINWDVNQPSIITLIIQSRKGKTGALHSSEHMYVFQTFLRGWRP